MSALLEATGRAVVLTDVGNAPLDVEVDVEELAFAGQELLGWIVARHHALLELLDDHR